VPLNSKLRSSRFDFLPNLDQHQVDLERISLFKVPLKCEAAAGLGCGVKAKPILQGLGRQPGVAQAWLNRNGTLAAVLWKRRIDPQVRGECVRSFLALQGLAARELTGVARGSALRHFSSGADWYRADAVDRLSEEEAASIAARLVRRVTAEVPMPHERTEPLLDALTKVCRHELVERPLTSARLRRQRIASEVVKAGRKLLDGAELQALQAGAALGHRPTKGEA
jgi:hypothetical protein